jgi:serine/threonine protein kinase
MEGTIIGRYRLIRKLGAGGMAEVYLAKHELMDCYAAVKLLLPEMSVRDGIVKRFFQEAQAAACIEHPGIVHVFDVGYAPSGRAYLAMELLSGETLGRRLRRQQRLSLEETLVIIRQLAGVIGAAHQRGIIHRDLKPDNLFLVRDPELQHGERVKVLDFGLAKLLESSVPTAGLTAQDAVFGTPGYMAPEQCRSSANVDARADLYAIGCIFYACLCGKPPFGNGGLDVLMAHIGQSPVAPRRHATTIPPAVDALILRLLEKDPTRRLASCEALIGELDHALRDTTGARQGSGNRRSSEPLVNDDGLTIRDDFLPDDAFMLLEDHESLARQATAGDRPSLPGLPPPPQAPMLLPVSETRPLRLPGRPVTDGAERAKARPALMLMALPPAMADEPGSTEQRCIEPAEDNSPSRGSMPTMGNGELKGQPRRNSGRRILWSVAGLSLLGGLMAAWVFQVASEEQAAGLRQARQHGSLTEKLLVRVRELEQEAHAERRSQSVERARQLSRLGDCEALAALIADAARLFPEVQRELEMQSAACVKATSHEAKASMSTGERNALKAQTFADAQKAYEANNITLASTLCRDAWKVAAGDESVAAFCAIVACKLKNAQAAERYYVHVSRPQRRGRIAETCQREGISVQN